MRAPTPPAGAVAHYERGRKEYLAGRYREALVELKTALALDPNSPNLVYNVARVNEDLAEFDEAIKYYRQYKSLLPEDAAEEREKTAQTIRRLQGAKDQQAQQQRNTAAVTPPPAGAPSNGRADAAFWLLAGTGLALAAGGGVTGFLAVRREQEVRDFVVGADGTYQEREDLGKEADALALASDVMSIAAGAAVLSAVVLFFARSDEPDGVEARVSITPGGGTFGLSTRF
jgi:tetratricopeptide (TPR) repeat protein